MDKYVVLDSAVKIKDKKYGRRVAVVELIRGRKVPRSIRIESKSIVRIVKIWENLTVGGDDPSYIRGRIEADAVCLTLNRYGA